MTVVAAVNCKSDVIVVADSRLTAKDNKGVATRRDVCQKLIVANGWSIVGLLGDLCLARKLLAGFVARLRDTPPEAPDWLRDDQQVRDFARMMARALVMDSDRKTADHRPCLKKRVELLIAWVDHRPSIRLGGVDGIDLALLPRTEVIVITHPGNIVTRCSYGIEMIGSGAKVAPQIRSGDWSILCNFARGTEMSGVQRCFITAEVLRERIAQAGIDTIGVLYQMAHLSPQGVRVVPHLYWAPVAPGFGTYIAMRMEDGAWVQEHRPTGVKIKLASPFEIQLKGPKWAGGKHEMFDPSVQLTRDSPGVLPEPTLKSFFPYDPPNVPPEVRPYWGDEPLAPLTWGPDPPPREYAYLRPRDAERRYGRKG